MQGYTVLAFTNARPLVAPTKYNLILFFVFSCVTTTIG